MTVSRVPPGADKESPETRKIKSSPAFEVREDPALRFLAVHFVGLERSGRRLPSEVADWTAEQRLASILQTGALYGFRAPWTEENRIVSVCDISAAELENAFISGLNNRGPCEPWALVLSRQQLWILGMRPAVYVDSEEVEVYRAASAQARGPGWRGMVVPTQLRWNRTTGCNDWLHEREWRYCWSDSEATEPILDVATAIVAVIVGREEWTPHGLVDRPLTQPVPQRLRTQLNVMRWVFDPATGHLHHDGRLVLP